MKKILITNDDGINASGIIRLAQVAKKFAQVWVVAPDGQRSAMSHSVNFINSFDVWEVDFPVEGVHAYACTGTPADCVRVGVLNIVPGGPDHVFSGINYGYNVATDCQYSATVGAAFEGAFLKVHSIAFSEDAKAEHDITDEYLEQIMEKYIEEPLDEDQIWNVNFPSCRPDEFKGIKENQVVSKGCFYKDHYTEEPGENGRITYHVVGERSWEAEEGSDLHSVINNYISIGKVNNLS